IIPTSYNNRASMESLLLVQYSSTALVNYEYDNKNGLFSAEMADWDHSLPLTFGFSFRKILPHRLGVEVGITYSYLYSKAENSSTKWKQQLHYLGVPVSLTYSPFQVNNWEFYGRIGGAADFNIAGRQRLENGGTTSKSFTHKGVQWSVSANVGAMYNINERVGIYVEPGVGHYFEFSNQPASYWQEHPTNFNLKFGVRTNF
ncbi:MAG: PorT family protein, partial [Rikenellaceae bacterium]|nr:PorT family protein [Rikenellaceae bacterium]